MITADMRSILDAIDRSPAVAALPTTAYLSSDPEFVELAGILADAMEECGHPWTAGMRRVHAGGHRPYCAMGGAAWRFPIDIEQVRDWIIPKSIYDRLQSDWMQWEYKVYSKASAAILALAEAMTEVNG